MKLTSETFEDVKLKQILITGFVDVSIASISNSLSYAEVVDEQLKSVKDTLSDVEYASNTVLDNVLSGAETLTDNIESDIRSLKEKYATSLSSLKSSRDQMFDDYDTFIKLMTNFENLDQDELNKLQDVNDRISDSVKGVSASISTLSVGVESKKILEDIYALADDDVVQVIDTATKQDLEEVIDVMNKLRSFISSDVISSFDNLRKSEFVVEQVLSTINEISKE